MNQKDSHKNKPVTYYRIESMDRYSGETFSGFMAAVYSSLALILDMRPDELDIVDFSLWGFGDIITGSHDEWDDEGSSKPADDWQDDSGMDWGNDW